MQDVCQRTDPLGPHPDLFKPKPSLLLRQVKAIENSVKQIYSLGLVPMVSYTTTRRQYLLQIK